MKRGAPGGRSPGKDRAPRDRAWQRLARLLRDERSRFVLVGAANTVFSTALFAGLVLLLGPEVPSVVSLVIAWFVSLLTGFFAHRLLVFRVRGQLLLDLLRYAGVNYTTLLLNIGALALLSDVLGLPPIPVQIAIVGVVIVVTYVGHKYFSFRRRG